MGRAAAAAASARAHAGRAPACAARMRVHVRYIAACSQAAHAPPSRSPANSRAADKAVACAGAAVAVELAGGARRLAGGEALEERALARAAGGWVARQATDVRGALRLWRRRRRGPAGWKPGGEKRRRGGEGLASVSCPCCAATPDNQPHIHRTQRTHSLQHAHTPMHAAATHLGVEVDWQPWPACSAHRSARGGRSEARGWDAPRVRMCPVQAGCLPVCPTSCCRCCCSRARLQP